jgi:hypothetical protein
LLLQKRELAECEPVYREETYAEHRITLEAILGA